MAKETSDEPKVRRKPGRVPTSCAECRRLKLRCNKMVPCEKCVSRGCGSICPEGSLTTGKGNRLILHNTEQLHERIEHLCTRIRELETALKTLQATVSSEPHPLLRQDLLQLRAQPGPTNGHPNMSAHTASSSSPESATLVGISERTNEDENFIDAFGTLTIGPSGESNFLGKTARSEYLIRALASPRSDSTLVLPRVSQRVILSYCAEGMTDQDEIGREVFSMLPPLSEAIRLCEIYLDSGQYIYCPVPRKELFDEILTTVYRSESFNSMSFACHHKLSLLFGVFSLGALFDQNSHPYSLESQEYYYLCKSAFGFSPLSKVTSLHALQAMIHFAQYQELADWESLGSNSTWAIVGCAVRAGQSIGLHLNGERWRLSPEMTQRRNIVFWQLYAYDTWQSFEFGRPPALHNQCIDCPLPEDTDYTIAADGTKQMGFHSWVWQYTALVNSIMCTAFGSKVPAYSVVLDLDKKIRDFPVPQRLQLCNPDVLADATATHYMQRWYVLMYKETVLLHLHRGYFAQALQDQPNDLIRHRYLPSVMSTYRSAWRLIQGLNMVRVNAPDISARINLVWSHALAGAIAMCVLVSRAPTSKMTQPSIAELDTVARLFEEAAPTCKPAGNMLDTIMSLKRKAHEAVDIGLSNGSGADDMSPAELDRLGGKTHLIAAGSQDSTHASAPRSSSSSPSQPFSFPSADVPGIHPTITADIRIMDVINPNTPSFDPNLFDFPAQFNGMDMMAPGAGDMVQRMDIFGNGNQNQDHPMGMGAFNLSSTEPFGFGDGPPPLPVPMLDATWQSFVEQLGF